MTTNFRVFYDPKTTIVVATQFSPDGSFNNLPRRTEPFITMALDPNNSPFKDNAPELFKVVGGVLVLDGTLKLASDAAKVEAAIRRKIQEQFKSLSWADFSSKSQDEKIKLLFDVLKVEVLR